MNKNEHSGAAAEMVQDLKEGLTGLATNIWAVIRSPAKFRNMIRQGRARRRDAGIQMRLNRSLRSQFIEAFNNSARGQLTVDADRMLRSYRMRNRLSSVLLRPYEMFSLINLPAKMITAMAFFKTMRLLTLPLLGVWGIAIPLGAMVGSRMGLVYRDAKNKSQEQKLAGEGFIVPVTFDVQDNKVSILGQEITNNFITGFPVLHTRTPEWVTSTYDSAGKIFGASEKLHAAGFEALRTKRLASEDIAEIRYAFANRALQGCSYAFAILFPEENVRDVIRSVKFLAEEKLPIRENDAVGLTARFHRAAQLPQDSGFVSLPAVILKAIEPFCVRQQNDGGLGMLAGKVTMDELRDLAKLYSLGISLDEKQARNVLRMISDPCFSDTLRFGQMVEVSLWPEKLSSLFDSLWKDGAYNALGYDTLKDFVVNADGWGEVALRLVRHDYAKNLSGENIRELAMPENAYWAHVYHDVRLTCPAAVKLQHDDLRDMTRQFGLATAEKLMQRSAPSNVVRFG